MHGSLLYLQTALFFLIAVACVYVLWRSGFYPWQRINLGIGTPHAYKAFIWSALALGVLRPIYGWRFGLALIFWWPLNETVGNSLYFLWHAFEIPVSEWASPGNITVLWLFPFMALWAFLMLRALGSSIVFRWAAFAPFVVVQLVWLSLGFHIQYDICCGRLLNGELFTEGMDLFWSVAFMFGVAMSALKVKKP